MSPRCATTIAAAAAALAALCAASALAASSTGDHPDAQPPKTDLQTKSGDLSDKLDKSNGVIHPRGAVDPGIDKKAPPVGDKPVIPPPGAPGSESNAQPK
jgi:hypothetical protein